MSVSIDEFIARASEWSPGFSGRIRGANPQEIQELTELVGFPLPEVHEQFLARMGHGDGGMHLETTGSVDISEVIAHYRICRAKGYTLPPRCVIVEANIFEGDISLELVPGHDPRVVFTSDDVEALCAESFVGYLSRKAFITFRHKPGLYRLSYSSSYRDVGMRHVVGVARRILLELGFFEHWFSDSISFCGERDDIQVDALQFENQGMSVLVSSQDFRKAQEVGNALAKEINLSYEGCI